MARWLVAFALVFTTVSAFALPIKTFRVSNGDAFDFQVVSDAPGSISFTGYEAISGFPNLPQGQAQRVRFYYSTIDFRNVTPQSPYIEVAFGMSSDGAFSIPLFAVGNFSRGQTYYFKAGLVNAYGDLLYFTPEFSSEFGRHSIQLW